MYNIVEIVTYIKWVPQFIKILCSGSCSYELSSLVINGNNVDWARGVISGNEDKVTRQAGLLMGTKKELDRFSWTIVSFIYVLVMYIDDILNKHVLCLLNTVIHFCPSRLSFQLQWSIAHVIAMWSLTFHSHMCKLPILVQNLDYNLLGIANKLGCVHHS